MCSLKELSEEYLQDALRMEARIRQLESQASRTVSLEVRRKLRRRINILHSMVCECRQTAFELEHYYDKPKEVVVHAAPKKCEPKREYRRSSGYGAPTPALVMHGKRTHKPAVSGLRAALSGRYDTG